MTLELRALEPGTTDSEAAIDCYCRRSEEEPVDARVEIRDRFERHAGYPGYRGLVAVDEDGNDGTFLGFVYGYTSSPGQDYHDRLASALEDALVERWLSDCFEFVEPAVEPAHRRRGVGSRLHDAILERVPHETSVLTARRDNVPAGRLYVGRGWQVIHDGFVPTPDADPMVVMAIDLP